MVGYVTVTGSRDGIHLPLPKCCCFCLNIANAEKNLLSKVRNDLGIDAWPCAHSKVDIHTSNSQEQGKTPGLPAGVCSSEASSGTSKGQQRGAGTTGGESSAKTSAFGNRGPRAKPKISDYPSPVRFPPPVPICWYSYRHQGLTIASSFYAPEMWTPNVIDTRCKMKRMLKNTSRRRKTSFHCCFRTHGKIDSKYALTSTLMNGLKWQEWSQNSHTGMRRKTANVFIVYDAWWPVLIKNGSWCSNPSMLTSAPRLMARSYGRDGGKLCDSNMLPIPAVSTILTILPELI
jgi:hypothetical protein